MNLNMTKRILSLVLTLALLISNVPAVVFAAEETTAATGEIVVAETSASTQATQPADEAMVSAEASRAVQTDLEAIIEQQIRAYAKSINKSNADDDAARAIAKHGITGRGKKLSVGSNHALTATLMNAELTIACVTDSIVKAVELMQMKKMQTLYGQPGYDWSAPYYGSNFFPNDQHLMNDLITHFGETPSTSIFNAYDQSMTWIGGHVDGYTTYKQVSINEKTIVYDVTLYFYDRFDFHGDNGSISKDILSLLGSVLFKEFSWDATVQFRVEIPNPCNHTPSQYHLIYDPEKEQLNADTADGFMPNSTQKLAQEINKKTYYYYALQNPITLRHDRPWVLTYTVNNSNEIAFSSAEVKSQNIPYLVDYHRGYLVVRVKRQNSDGVVIDNYYGLGISRYFRYSTNNTYTFRLHNVVNSDESNMIYVTVYNETLQKTVLEETPMNDHYVIEDGQWVLVDDNSDGINGIDLTIRYLSNQSFRFYADIFEMKVWECGVDGEGGGYFVDKVTKPTCAAKGYTTRTCSLCGYSYKGSYVSAKGHSYGDWTQVKAPDCTAAGQEQRTCKTCKETETRDIAPNGHSHEAVVTPPTCTEDGYTTHTCHCGDSYVDSQVDATGHNFEDEICTVCGSPERIPGDIDGNEIVDVDDVLALLWHVLFPEDYPINAEADFDGNGMVDVDDVLTLLWHVLFPDDYPL